jgi:hypothetical protein
MQEGNDSSQEKRVRNWSVRDMRQLFKTNTSDQVHNSLNDF